MHKIKCIFSSFLPFFLHFEGSHDGFMVRTLGVGYVAGDGYERVGAEDIVDADPHSSMLAGSAVCKRV